MTSPILLHPHSSLLFITVPLTFSRACMHTHYQSALSIARMQSFSSGQSPMKAHTHTHPPLHHIGHSLSLTCMRNDRCSSMCVCTQLGLSQFSTQTDQSIYPVRSHPLSHAHIDQSIPLYIGLTYIDNTPTLIIYPTPPSHHPCLPLHLSDACTMAKTGGSKGPAPLKSLYIEANMNVIIRQLLLKMV